MYTSRVSPAEMFLTLLECMGEWTLRSQGVQASYCRTPLLLPALSLIGAGHCSSPRPPLPPQHQHSLIGWGGKGRLQTHLLLLSLLGSSQISAAVLPAQGTPLFSASVWWGGVLRKTNAQCAAVAASCGGGCLCDCGWHSTRHMAETCSRLSTGSTRYFLL